jgi:hypothetical protein
VPVCRAAVEGPGLFPKRRAAAKSTDQARSNSRRPCEKKCLLISRRRLQAGKVLRLRLGGSALNEGGLPLAFAQDDGAEDRALYNLPYLVPKLNLGTQLVRKAALRQFRP